VPYKENLQYQIRDDRRVYDYSSLFCRTLFDPPAAIFEYTKSGLQLQPVAILARRVPIANSINSAEGLQ
jgi:hypothetical protein